MQRRKKPISLRAYKRKPKSYLTFFIFLLLTIYLVITIFLYLTSKHVSVYEVREGSILSDNAYTAFALRHEKIIKADGSGYINFFPQSTDKIGARTNVYSLSDQKLSFDGEDTKEAEKLTSDETNALVLKLQEFNRSFDDENFSETYSLKDDIDTLLRSKSNQSRDAQLKKLIKEGNDSLKVKKADTDGFILYGMDGYEDYSTDQISEALFDQENYQVTSIENNSQVSDQQAIYKVITDNTWNLFFPLSEQSAKELKDTTIVKIKFAQDHQTEKANLEVVQRNKKYYGILTLYTGMIRYAEERYVDIELIQDDESGLKIPKSSVTEKEFYTIPEDFLTKGNDNSNPSIQIVNGNGTTQTQAVTVYYHDNENGLLYLDPADFEKDTLIQKDSSQETFLLNETAKLLGVFSINKGYAVFKQIKILCDSGDYYIVESGNDYGLSNYDHIALDGTTIKEGEVVF